MANKRKNPIISLAQIRYFDTPEKNNVKKIIKYIKKAKEQGADIVCFPETCVHKTDNLELNHELIKEIQEACKKNSIWAIITDNFTLKNKPYKMSLLIKRDGSIMGKYKKINLYDDKARPGKKIFVRKTDFAEIGIAICWDLSDPELFNRMKKSGAEIVFCPSKWCYEKEAHKEDHKEKEKELLKSMIQARAFENLFFVALVNPIMKRHDLVSYSAIYSPHKLIEEIDSKEGLITAEINLGEIKKFSHLYPEKIH
jgi:predicted amidohydrolase